MKFNLELTISEKIDLELFLSRLKSRYNESGLCTYDSDYKRIELFLMSIGEFDVISKLLNSLVYDEA